MEAERVATDQVIKSIIMKSHKMLPGKNLNWKTILGQTYPPRDKQNLMEPLKTRLRICCPQGRPLSSQKEGGGCGN